MKFIKGLVIASILFPSALFAQNDPIKYANTITEQDLKEHLIIIAGAEMEGRETASEGERKAAKYIEKQFSQLGLKYSSVINGYQQLFPLFKDTLLSSSLKIGKGKYKFGTHFIIMPGSSLKENIRSKEIIFIGYGIDDKNYNDYQGKDVNGKIVVFFTGEPKVDGKALLTVSGRNSGWTISRKTLLANQKGAAAAIVINPSMDTLAKSSIDNALRTELYYPKKIDKTEPERVTYISAVNKVAREIFNPGVYDELVAKVKAAEPLNNYNIEIDSKTKIEYQKKNIPFTSRNVVGFIEGSDKKDEYVVMTAHFDHLGKRGDVIYYGADDDGSGTVSIIEIAEAFAKAKAEGNGPRRSIIFMAVSGEEKGLLGSQYYSENPLFPLNKTTVNLNIDMVGRSDPDRKHGDSTNYVYVVGDDKISSDLKKISVLVNKKYSNLELDYKFNDPNDRNQIFYRSDHYNFAKKGVPIIFYYDGMLRPDYHRPSDTIDKINFNLMEKRVKFIFLTAWEIANREEMLKRDLTL